MNKTFLLLSAVIALVGVFSCVALEPVHALQDQTESTEQHANEESCCFVCHSNHHVAIQPITYSFSLVRPATRFDQLSSLLPTESPHKSIFRPPITA